MQGLCEGLVIRQDMELPAVKHIPEMPEAEIGGDRGVPRILPGGMHIFG